MLHILVPFDFSPAAERSLAFAADLHRSVGGSLRVLHILSPAPAMLAGPEVPRTITGAEIEETHAGLHRALDCNHVAAAIAVEIARDVGQAIVLDARGRPTDLIVMGTHGRGRLARLVLGSVADYVVRRAECPVTVVRAPRN